jgi:phage portal protein BeeE
MNLMNNLLGWIWKKNNFVYYRVNVGDVGEVWMSVDEPRILYDTIPQLPIVINRIAKMTANGIWEIVDKDGVKVDTPEAMAIIERLQNPSPFQTENEYIESLVKQFCVYGNTFSKKNTPSKLAKVPLTLITLSAQYCTPILTGKLYDQLTIGGAVSSFRYQDSRMRDTFLPSDVIWAKNTDLDNPLVGISPLMSLKYPLSNIKHAYAYRNSILAKKGALGFVSSEATEMGATRQWSENERTDFEKDYFKKYGTEEGQSPFMLTKVPVKFTHTSYPTKDMLLFEEVEANTATICQTFGLSTNVLDTKTTFENLKNGIIQSYQDCIFPIADTLAQSHKTGLNLPKEWTLRLSYEHIELLKESKLRGAQALNQGLQAISNAQNMGIIDQQQAQSASESLISTII